MTLDKLISELLSPPERARKGDFVLNLSRGGRLRGPGRHHSKTDFDPAKPPWCFVRLFPVPRTYAAAASGSAQKSQLPTPRGSGLSTENPPFTLLDHGRWSCRVRVETGTEGANHIVSCCPIHIAQDLSGVLNRMQSSCHVDCPRPYFGMKYEWPLASGALPS